MSRPAIYRLVIILGFVALFEVLCLTGTIDVITMQPPHRMIMDLFAMLSSGSLSAAIAKTLSNAAIAFVLALVVAAS